MTSYSTITTNINTVLVNSSTFSNYYVVYVSSSTTPGKIATVRDVGGLVSSTRTIIVSTLKNVLYSDSRSSITINNPFGYISLKSRDTNTWDILNDFPQTVGYVSSLSLNDSISSSNILVKTNINTSILNTNSLSTIHTSISTLYSDNIYTNIQNINNSFINSLNTNNISNNYLFTNYVSSSRLSSIYLHTSTLSTTNLRANTILSVSSLITTLSSQILNTSILNISSLQSSNIVSINNYISSLSTINFNNTNMYTSSLLTSTISTNFFNINQLVCSSITLTDKANGYISISSNGNQLLFNNAPIVNYISSAPSTLNMNNYNISNINSTYAAISTNNIYALTNSNISVNQTIGLNNFSIINLTAPLSSFNGVLANLVLTSTNIYNVIPNYSNSNSITDITTASPQFFTNSLFTLSTVLSTYTNTTTANELNVLYCTNPSTQKLWKIDYNFKANLATTPNISVYLAVSNITTRSEHQFDIYNSTCAYYPVNILSIDTNLYDTYISGTDTICLPNLNYSNNISLNTYYKIRSLNSNRFSYLTDYNNAFTSPSSYVSTFYTNISYGNHTYIASANTNIYISKELNNWSNSSVPSSNISYYNAAYGKNIWVMGCDALSNKNFVYSTDSGKTFKLCASQPQTLVDARCVSYGNGLWVATGALTPTTGFLYYSVDGSNWSNGNGLVFNGVGRSVFFGNNIFIAVGQGNTNPILRSTDGKTWSSVSWISSQPFSNATAVSYGYNTWYVAGCNYLVNSINNGLSWSITSALTNSNVSSMTVGDGLALVINNRLVFSSNYGLSYSSVQIPFSNVYSIVNANGYYVIVGSNGIAKASIPNIVSYSLQPLYP